MTNPDRWNTLEEVAHSVMACTDCRLSQGRTQGVPGEGPADAKLFFVGEGPGWHEDQQGRPFVGPAGKFLEELLALVGLRREDVFIGNMLKSRPPGNRDPLPDEIEACRKYLDAQLHIVNPKVVVALGRHSLSRFCPGQTIGKIHGTWRREGERVHFAMYHPAAALHQQSLRKVIQEDMLKLPQALEAAEKAEKMEAQPAPPEQLSLF
ncbi:MAG: uracil-DNA glycosylase [Dehalococcoidia bacterium]